MRRFLGPYGRGFLTGSVLSLSCCAVSIWYGASSNTNVHPNLTDLKLPKLLDTDQTMEDVQQLNAARDILKYGIPDRGPVVRSYSGHILAYDQARKIPVWVAEHLTPKSIKGSANRKHSHFKADPNVPPVFSAENSDFLKQPGWSRGHMAPAGDFKHSQAAMNSTFYLTNVVPQNYDNNAGFWNRFEMFCRDLTKEYSDVRIFTGPLFLPNMVKDSKQYVNYEVLGKNMIAAPTHLYKLVIAENNSSNQKAIGAFIVPNEPISFDHKLTEYQVPLETLEKSSGVVFLPLINPSDIVNLCTVDSCELMTEEKFQLYVFSRRLSRANSKEKANKIFAELKSKGLEPDSFFLQQFEDKQKVLDEKEKRKAEL